MAADSSNGRRAATVTDVIETLSTIEDGLPGAQREDVEQRVSEQRLEDAIRRGDVYEVGGMVKVARIYP